MYFIVLNILWVVAGETGGVMMGGIIEGKTFEHTFLPQSESEDWQRILKSDSGLSQVSGKQQQPNMLATVWKHLQINESVTFHINDSTNFWIPVCVEGPKPSLYFSDPANKRWGKTSCSLVQSPAQSGWSHLNSQFHLSSTWFHINYNKNVAQASSQIIRSSDSYLLLDKDPDHLQKIQNWRHSLMQTQDVQSCKQQTKTEIKHKNKTTIPI